MNISKTWENGILTIALDGKMDINVLLSEILYRKRLNTNKRLEYKLNAIFLSQVKIGRLACCRLRL